jgi:hypothetical protein
MARLKDTEIQGTLSVSGAFSIIGESCDLSCEVDDAFINIYNSIDGIEMLQIESDE